MSEREIIMKHRFNTSYKFSVFEKKVCPIFFKKPLEAFNNLIFNIRNNCNTDNIKNVKILVAKTTYEVVHINGEELDTIKDIYKKHSDILRLAYYKDNDNQPIHITKYDYMLRIGTKFFSKAKMEIPSDILEYAKEHKVDIIYSSYGRSLMKTYYVASNDINVMSKLKLKHDYEYTNISEIKNAFNQLQQKLSL